MLSYLVINKSTHVNYIHFFYDGVKLGKLSNFRKQANVF